MTLVDYIPSDGQRRIAQAITEAEKHTLGEICVHVTPRCRGDVMRRAAQVFNRLGLFRTRHRNAVLVFVAYQDRRLAILGDVGIDGVVQQDFWDGEVELLGQMLRAGRPVDGLCQVITRLGEKLSALFPAERDDVNELSNEVTYDEMDDD